MLSQEQVAVMHVQAARLRAEQTAILNVWRRYNRKIAFLKLFGKLFRKKIVLLEVEREQWAQLFYNNIKAQIR